jgi:hypothetical protein
MIGLSRGWAERLAEIGRTAERDLLVCAPYIRSEGVELVIESLSSTFRASGSIVLLTDLSPLNICQKLVDPEAILRFFDAAGAVDVRHLPRVHAKVYVADEAAAIVTSGNLTAGGLFRNFEYGVQTRKPDEVGAIRADITAYSLLGAAVDRQQLEAYSAIGRELASAYRRQERGINASHRREFQRRLREAEDELIAVRTRGGAMTTTFERTIEYLLARDGPLATAELHPLVQALHPDLCDDSVDRVINGQRFGKLWKHVVRSAQSHLKSRGVIELHEGRWRLVAASS